MSFQLSAFANRETASLAAAAFAHDALARALDERGHADCFVSGGKSPQQMLQSLSEYQLDWSRVTVGLVDERWVASDHPESNERLVRANLLRGSAGAAGLLPMKTLAHSAREAAAERSLAYAPHCARADFVLLGMGEDGHTASWFPDSPQLESVLSGSAQRTVKAVEAPSATVTDRMTLTASAVCSARRAALICFGRTKRDVIEGAAGMNPMACPVRIALDGLGDRLTVFWAN